MERQRDALNCPRVFDLRRDGIEVYTRTGFKRPSVFRGGHFFFDPSVHARSYLHKWIE